MPRTQLQLEVGADYSVPEFIELFQALETLYNLAALPIVVAEIAAAARNQLQPPFWQTPLPPNDVRWLLEYPFAPRLRPLSRLIREMPRVLGPERLMRIRSIHLESPGDIKVDLGLAEVAKELREWTRWLTNGRTTDKLEILERKVRILKEVGYSEDEIRRAMSKGDVALDRLLGLAKEGKLLIEKTLFLEEP
jgi:hypothetical protein